MKILLMTGTLLPQPGNNANLISKLIPYLTAEHEVHIFVPAFDITELPETYFGVPVHWATDSTRDFKRRYVYPAISKLVDPDGYSDALQEMILLREIEHVRKAFEFDAVISTMEPFTSAITASQLKEVKKILYIMDPPDCVRGGKGTPFRNRKLGEILAKQHAILTTPFIREALKENGYGEYDGKITSVGFPMIENHIRGNSEIINKSNGKINLLFCGWMYSDIRSPKYFLDIVSRLDERFCVYFMGKECDKLRERFEFETKAEVITLPQQPYQVAIDAMFDADILINIGNSVHVHMPSKTLEYINTGKPMVNFYKFEGCPTTYYTEHYPLCLNLYEGDEDIDGAARKFADFCFESKGKTVNRELIEREFTDCTPQYIAQCILDKLGDWK